MKPIALIILICCFRAAFAQQPQLLLPVVSNDHIDKVFLSPDGKKMVCSTLGIGKNSSEIKVWDVRSRKLLYTLENNFIVNNSVWLNGEGRVLSVDGEGISVRELEDGKPVFRIALKEIGFASFTHDGSRIIATVADSVKLWSAADGRLLDAFPGGSKELYPAVISPDDGLLATCFEGTVTIWDLAKKQIQERFRAAPDIKPGYPQENMADAISFSSDGHFFFAHFFDSTFYIKEIGLEAPWLQVKVPDVTVSASGKFYAMLSGEALTVNQTDSRQSILQKKLERSIRKLSFSNDDELLCETGSYYNGEVINKSRLYDLRTGLLTDSALTSLPFSFTPFVSSSLLIYTRPGEDGRDILLTNLLSNGKRQGPPLAYMPLSRNITAFSVLGAPGLLAASYGDSLLRILDSHSIRAQASYPLHTAAPAVLGNRLLVDFLSDTLHLQPLPAGTSRHIPLTAQSIGLYMDDPCSRLVIDDYAGEMRLFDLHAGKVTDSVAKSMHNFATVYFLPRSQKILVNYFVRMFDLQSYDLQSAKPGIDLSNSATSDIAEPDIIQNFSSSADGGKVATVSPSKIVVWDLVHQKAIRTLKESVPFSCSIFLGDSLVYGLNNGQVVFGTKRLQLHHSAVYRFFTDTLNAELLSVEVNGTALLTDLTTLQRICIIQPDPGTFPLAVDFKGGRAYFSDNALVSAYSLKTGQKLISFAKMGGNAFVYLTPQNYYTVDPEYAARLAFKSGGNILSFDQLDVKYNRPDKVLEAMGSPDRLLIASYREAYLKRLHRLGITDTSRFGGSYRAPVAEIKNRGQLAYEQTGAMLRLQISGKDSSSLLDHMNIWINGNPLYGMQGFSLRRRKRLSIDTSLAVPLAEGENQVEVSVTNVGGLESFREPLLVRYTPPTPDSGRTWFIGIGMDHFLQADNNLRWSKKDIHDLALAFKRQYGSRCVLDTLFNNQVNLETVKALKRTLLKTGINDRVIIAYSGHGLLSKNDDYYLSAYSTDFNEPEKNSIPYEALENLLDSIPARQKLLLVDACNSGEVDKDELNHYSAVPTAEGATARVPRITKPVIGMKNSFALMQELFNNTGKSTGATIIAAASGTQYALEKDELKNGVFTYSILEYFALHPHCKVSDLKNYVNRRVSEITDGRQVPTTRTENSVFDWQVW